jgi:hypothetical protein
MRLGVKDADDRRVTARCLRVVIAHAKRNGIYEKFRSNWIRDSRSAKSKGRNMALQIDGIIIDAYKEAK